MQTAMIVTGIILTPTVLATPAVQDLVNLRTVVNAAANTIGDVNNPNKGWGFGGGSGNGQMGTADLVNNITATVLGIKFQVDTNKTAWLFPDNSTIPGANGTTPTPAAPTLPLTTSLDRPSSIPTAAPNATADLSVPYTDYVSAMPNLSTALTSLGRAWHREMNTPVREAIAGLQQAISTLQSTMIQDNLISSQAVVRTLRASSSLANAQTSWNRFLNLPGRAGSNDGDSSDASVVAGNVLTQRGTQEAVAEGDAVQSRRLPPTNGRLYTHEELWGRDEERTNMAGESAENARVHVPFSA